jgi:hypothetical protein
MPRLDQTLRRILALTLVSPAATVAACHADGDAPGEAVPSVDASVSAPARDAGSEGAAGDAASLCLADPVDAAFFGEDGACSAFVRLPCGVPPALRGEACNPDVDLCTTVCPSHFFFLCDFPAASCLEGGLLPDADVFIECTRCGGASGRRPVGLEPAEEARSGSRIGRYFASVSYLEAASVVAFRHLRARLARFGGPPRLLAAAGRAARDERRHARATSVLAKRFGAPPGPLPPPVSEIPLDFEAFVAENAVEGCVRETFAALVALHQAARSTDPAVARAFRRIATDELRHASLAWAIDRWATRRLPGEARSRIRRAQGRALGELRASAGAASRGIEGITGLPCRSIERALVDAFASELFAT